jgi:multidrug efflux pump subunit AcrA (membrane-fusion protein)
VKKAPVVLGGFTGGSVEVTSGLSKGDQVVASGVQQLHEGVEVRPVVD